MITIDRLLEFNSSIEAIQLMMNSMKEQELNQALIDFSAVVPEIGKTETGQNLAHEFYQYAKIEDIQRTIKPYLAQFGLSYHFNQKKRDNVITVQCVITHVGGGKRSITMSAAEYETDKLVSEQITATTTSYLKRYTLSNALGLILVGEDNDCNHAQPFEHKNEQPQPEPQESQKPIEIDPEIPNYDQEMDEAIAKIEAEYKAKKEEQKKQLTNKKPKNPWLSNQYDNEQAIYTISIEEDEKPRFIKSLKDCDDVTCLDENQEAFGLTIYMLEGSENGIVAMLARANIDRESDGYVIYKKRNAREFYHA